MISAVFGAYQRTVRTMQRGTLSGSRLLMDVKGTFINTNSDNSYVTKFPKIDEIKIGNRTNDVRGIFAFPIQEIVIKINSNKPFKDTTRVAFNLIPCDSSSVVIGGLNASSTDGAEFNYFHNYADLNNPTSTTAVYVNTNPIARDFYYKVIDNNTINLSDATVVVVNDGVELHFPGKQIYMTNHVVYYDSDGVHKNLLGNQCTTDKNFTHECSAQLRGNLHNLNYEIIEYY